MYRLEVLMLICLLPMSSIHIKAVSNVSSVAVTLIHFNCCHINHIKWTQTFLQHGEYRSYLTVIICTKTLRLGVKA